MKNVLLFGSTGAVGRGCLDVLTRRGDVSLVIAGRDEARLREVASAIQADVEIARLDVDRCGSRHRRGHALRRRDQLRRTVTTAQRAGRRRRHRRRGALRRPGR